MSVKNSVEKRESAQKNFETLKTLSRVIDLPSRELQKLSGGKKNFLRNLKALIKKKLLALPRAEEVISRSKRKKNEPAIHICFTLTNSIFDQSIHEQLHKVHVRFFSKKAHIIPVRRSNRASYVMENKSFFGSLYEVVIRLERQMNKRVIN